MGYWLSSHPTLRYISIPRKTTWADAFVEVPTCSGCSSRTASHGTRSMAHEPHPAALGGVPGAPAPVRRATVPEAPVLACEGYRVRSTLYWVPHHPVCRPSDATIATAGRNSRRAVLEPAASAISPGTTSRRCPLTAWLQHEGARAGDGVREGPRKRPIRKSAYGTVTNLGLPLAYAYCCIA